MANMDLAADLGRLTVTPDTGQVGSWGTWVVTHHVGSAGVARGGGVQVALPVRWHQWYRNSSRRVQTVDPTEAFYVTARASREGVRLGCEMADAIESDWGKSARLNLGGTRARSRYGWTVRITVEEGALRPGDTIDVVYGDTSQGGRGFTPPLFAGSPELVHAAVDPSGDGRYETIPDERLPLLSHTPGAPVQLLMVMPSRSVVNEPVTLRMVALDGFQNPVPMSDTTVHLMVVEGEAILDEEAVKLGGQRTWGACSVKVTPTSAGVLRLRGTSEGGALFSRSNPSKVHEEAPPERLLWGDIHSHTQYSYDGTGTADDHFRYARHAALLDVYCASDHNHLSLTHQDWMENIEDTEKWYQPGEFVTLFGFEASYGRPYGHHNVYYPGPEGTFWDREDLSLEEIWSQGTPGEMLTIPHHTGGGALFDGGQTHDWSIDDPRFRTTVEIYSSHGHSEEYAPNHPLSMDISDFTFQSQADPGNYVQDAWLAGLKLGVIASSDNHNSQPGKEGFGVIAVWTPEATREAVFEAIRQRRTYGTTGSRIYLEFYVNGFPMGSEVDLERGQVADVHVEVLGTRPLRWIEVLRADLDHPDEGFSIVSRQWFQGLNIKTEEEAPLGSTLDWSDLGPPANGMYYVRVRQRDPVHGRVAEAWTSPVWVRVI